MPKYYLFNANIMQTENFINQGKPMKQCEVCCSPMQKPEEHGGGNPANTWCTHCCHTDGSHKSYDEIHKDMTAFMLSDECTASGMQKAKDNDEAIARATAFMQQMPVWQKEKGKLH